MRDIEETVGEVVLPGDTFSLGDDTDRSLILGAGLVIDDTALLESSWSPDDSNNEKDDVLTEKMAAHMTIRAVKCGVIISPRPNSYCLANAECRTYRPVVGHVVIGVGVKRSVGEHHRLNIGASDFAFLPHLSFEGATKRHFPEVRIDDVVLCRVVVAGGGAVGPTLLSCVTAGPGEKANGLGVLTAQSPQAALASSRGDDAAAAAEEWMEGVRPTRKHSALLRVSPDYCLRLLAQPAVLLAMIGRHVAYEAAVGLNGFVWVACSAADEVALVRKCVIDFETRDVTNKKAVIKRVREIFLS